MEIMVSLVMLSLGALAVFMHLRTREVKNPLQTIDVSGFTRDVRPEDLGTVTRGIREQLGAIPETEVVRSDGEKYLYRATIGSGLGSKRITALLAGDGRVIAVSEAVSM